MDLSDLKDETEAQVVRFSSRVGMLVLRLDGSDTC